MLVNTVLLKDWELSKYNGNSDFSPPPRTPPPEQMHQRYQPNTAKVADRPTQQCAASWPGETLKA